VVIFDTNVLVSAALISGSKADACVRAVYAPERIAEFDQGEADLVAWFTKRG
jgi:hypothetical protein